MKITLDEALDKITDMGWDHGTTSHVEVEFTHQAVALGIIKAGDTEILELPGVLAKFTEITDWEELAQAAFAADETWFVTSNLDWFKGLSSASALAILADPENAIYVETHLDSFEELNDEAAQALAAALAAAG